MGNPHPPSKSLRVTLYGRAVLRFDLEGSRREYSARDKESAGIEEKTFERSYYDTGRREIPIDDDYESKMIVFDRTVADLHNALVDAGFISRYSPIIFLSKGFNTAICFASQLTYRQEGHHCREGELTQPEECHARGEAGYRPQQATVKWMNGACWRGEHQADVNGAVKIADRYLRGGDRFREYESDDRSAEYGAV